MSVAPAVPVTQYAELAEIVAVGAIAGETVIGAFIGSPDQAGFGSILDLITAQQDESNARVQRIQSYLDWYTVLARLNLAVGGGDLITTSTENKK